MGESEIIQLTEIIRKAVRQEIQAKNTEDVFGRLLSPKETCRLFKPEISIKTLENWTKRGLLVKHPVGGRVFYKYSDVMESVDKIRPYSRNNEPFAQSLNLEYKTAS